MVDANSEVRRKARQIAIVFNQKSPIFSQQLYKLLDLRH